MLSLVLPTYNESKNLPELLPVVREVLRDVPHEVIIVDDDSPDETWRVAQELAKEYEDLHVIRRIGRSGLSSAVIEGFLAAKGDVFAVMDADGQHDTHLLAKLYAAVKEGSDVAIGSRYIDGGSVGDWDERRFKLSRMATALAIKLCRVKVNDPMSGFFALKRDLFEKIVDHLNPKGFKILLDLLVHAPKGTTARELPFTFGERLHGESKLSAKVQIEFLEYLYDVTVGHWIPLVFVKYCMVGFLGVFVNLAAYWLFSKLIIGSDQITVGGFSLAVLCAIETAIIFNFMLNNVWTFARVRLRGKAALVGFGKYNIACAFGALANVAVSVYLFRVVFLSETIAVVGGACTGICWNYTMSRMFAWKG